jgi:hypothetical protein
MLLFLGILFGGITAFLFFLLNSLSYHSMLGMISKINPRGDIMLLKKAFNSFTILNLGQVGTAFLSAWCFARISRSSK